VTVTAGGCRVGARAKALGPSPGRPGWDRLGPSSSICPGRRPRTRPLIVPVVPAGADPCAHLHPLAFGGNGLRTGRSSRRRLVSTPAGARRGVRLREPVHADVRRSPRAGNPEEADLRPRGPIAAARQRRGPSPTRALTAEVFKIGGHATRRRAPPPKPPPQEPPPTGRREPYDQRRAWTASARDQDKESRTGGPSSSAAPPPADLLAGGRPRDRAAGRRDPATQGRPGEHAGPRRRRRRAPKPKGPNILVIVVEFSCATRCGCRRGPTAWGLPPNLARLRDGGRLVRLPLHGRERLHAGRARRC